MTLIRVQCLEELDRRRFGSHRFFEGGDQILVRHDNGQCPVFSAGKGFACTPSSMPCLCAFSFLNFCAGESGVEGSAAASFLVFAGLERGEVAPNHDVKRPVHIHMQCPWLSHTSRGNG